MPNPKGHENSIKDSQFKAAWQSGPTRTIRVPIALATITLEYARQLDQTIEPRDTKRLADAKSITTTIEPRDTSRLADPKIITITTTIEPRDTGVRAENQSDNLAESVVTESRDTVKSQAELEDAKVNYAALLEPNGHVTNKLRQEVQKLQLQIEEWQARCDELHEELSNREEICVQLQSELSHLKRKSALATELLEEALPDAATILSQLRGKRKKSPVTLADIELILEMI